MESNKLNSFNGLSHSNTFDSVFKQIEHNNEIKTPNQLNINIRLLQESIIRMHDLGYIAQTADSSIVLPVPIMVFGNKTPQETIDSFEKDKEFTQNSYPKNLETNNRLERKSGQMSGLALSISTLYPSFCKDMKEKISASDYELYSSQVKKFKASIRNMFTYSPKVSAKDTLLEKQDEIAEVTDTLEFSKACKIDDLFMISELSHFIELVNALPEDKKKPYTYPTILSIDGRQRLSSFELANSIINERKGHVSKIDDIIALYQKLQQKKYIVSETSKSKEDSER